MPCYRCGVRQVDPVRGHSPWQRGVRANQQVLICPDCQSAPGLSTELDQCRQCGSARLVRRLGEVECRACGFVVPPEDAGLGAGLGAAGAAGPAGTGGGRPARAGGGGPGRSEPGEARRDRPGEPGGDRPGGGVPEGGSFAAGNAPGLAEEVAQALERVLRGGSRVPPASAAMH